MSQTDKVRSVCTGAPPANQPLQVPNEAAVALEQLESKQRKLLERRAEVQRQWRDLLDPSQSQWEEIRKELDARATLMTFAEANVSPAVTDAKHRMALAATELFVAKAQEVLKKESDELKNRGLRSLKYGIGGSLAAALVLALLPYREHFDDNQAFAAYMVRATSIVAFLAAGLTQLIVSGYKHIHESMVQWNRRHSLRFGRLFLYLHHDKGMTFNDFERAFDWNHQPTTAFAKVDVQVATPVAAATSTINGLKKDTKAVRSGKSSTGSRPRGRNDSDVTPA